MSDHAYQRALRGDPILMHGARVYADRTVNEHTGRIVHSCRVLPLDAKRARPLGVWIRFEDTGHICALVTSRVGHEHTLDGATLDELVQATVAAID